MSEADDLRNEFAAQREKKGLPPSRLPPGGGGGYDSSMEHRITKLEEDMKDVKKDLTDLKVSVAQISGKLDILVAKLPSWWQAPLGAGGLIALMASLMGLAKTFHWI